MVVRFNEYTRYDITKDQEVVRFMGITNGGSYHLEKVCPTYRSLRETKAQFMEKVIDLMERAVPPCEVELG